MASFTSSLIELFERSISFHKVDGVYYNGENNDYPEKIDRVIDNSVTGLIASKIYAKAILCQGNQHLNDFVVNSSDDTTFYDFLSRVSKSVGRHGGAFINVQYNLECEVISASVLPYRYCRVGKKDHKKYNGKILVSENWSGREALKKPNAIDVFNPKKEVIQAQMLEQGENYKGQVLFFNPEDTIYPLAPINAAFNDADAEFGVGTFKSLSLKSGFFGKKIFITANQTEKSEENEFENEVQNFLGVQNMNRALVVKTDFEGDNIDEFFKVIDVKTNINDKLLAHTEVSAANNVRKAYGIPSVLVENSDNSVFGQSGELIKQAKIYIQEQLSDVRGLVERQILKPIFSRFKNLNAQDFKIQENDFIN